MKMLPRFAITLLGMTILCTAVWQRFVTDSIYHCSDPGVWDFLSPGHWVHQPVEVARVVVNSSMSAPDTIKSGWTVRGLWGLWWTFLGASVGVSTVVTVVTRPKPQH